jgi:hypothetical protein
MTLRPSHLFEQWQNAFRDVVAEQEIASSLRTASLAEDLRSWTASLTASVVTSCSHLNWKASAKGHPSEEIPKHGQEYLNIDVMAFESKVKTTRWALPIAVFELENARTDTRIAYSLWKVLCIRAQLRVVFAFRRDWESSRNMVSDVCQDVIGGLSLVDRMEISGETVIVVGNRGDGESFPWGYFKCWRLDPSRGVFDKC